jgi:hypothetical protein
MSNYPPGAEHDPSAPYNQTDDDGLCIYCDRNEIEEIAMYEAKQMALEMNMGMRDGQESFDYHDFFDTCFQKEMDSRSECKQCYLDNHADDWEDDI